MGSGGGKGESERGFGRAIAASANPTEEEKEQSPVVPRHGHGHGVEGRMQWGGGRRTGTETARGSGSEACRLLQQTEAEREGQTRWMDFPAQQTTQAAAAERVFPAHVEVGGGDGRQ